MKKISIQLVIAILLASCSPMKTTLEQKNINNEVPTFDNYISPITIPIQPHYSPVITSFNYSIATYISLTENNTTKNKSKFEQISGKTKIISIGDKLTWEVDITNVVSEGKTVSHSLPLASCRILTDKYGDIIDYELSSPALTYEKVNKKKIDEFLNIIRSSIKNFGSYLPKKPVKSGDPIIKIDQSSFSNFLDDDITRIESSGDIQFIIDGWSIFNGNKVIVASIDNNLSLEIQNKLTVDVTLSGYSLFDPVSYQILDSNFIVVMKPQNLPKDDFNARMLFHFTNEIE